MSQATISIGAGANFPKISPDGFPEFNQEESLKNWGKHQLSFFRFLLIQKKSPFSIQEWAVLLDIKFSKLSADLQPGRAVGKFDTFRTERIMEIMLLVDKGVDVFGSMEKFSGWLNATIPALGNQQPKAWLTSTFGIRHIFRELGRIEHGIFA